MKEKDTDEKDLAPEVNVQKEKIEFKSKKLSRENLIKTLTGRTLMVYFFLLNKKLIGVRELQRQLNLSSPSVAKYHLEKLEDLDLVENRNGIYHLNKKANLPVLTSWILIGRQLLPKVMFAAIFFTTLFFGYLIFVYSYWNKDSMFVILIGILLLIYLWFDVYLQYKRKPM